MVDNNDDAEPIKIPPDEVVDWGPFGAKFPKVSKKRKEEIIEWFFDTFPDVDYVMMGDEIIIKDRRARMMFKMVFM